MNIYELAILGEPTSVERSALEAALSSMLNPYGLTVGGDVALYDGGSVSRRRKQLAFAAAYFRGSGHADEGVAKALVESNAIIIPVVGPLESFEHNVPSFLREANGYVVESNDDLIKLAQALLEGLGLLRRQRRAFVSYRRRESRTAAVQIHNELSANGFDVFLDTHDIQPGEQFQELLWHQLCDSDVMVMLDTATYFEGRWTRQELGRARATGIHVLQIVWPHHTRNAQTDLAETIFLEDHELGGDDGPIIDKTIDQIVRAVENLRSRSVAARMMSIVGKLKADVVAIGGKVGAVGAHRAVPITLPHGKVLFAYPVVGVPTADILNEVFEKAHAYGQGSDALLVYDHVGLRPAWLKHLKWLDDNIDVVKSIRVREAAWALAEF